MAKKKDTKTMLIRGVPKDLWSEVDAYCEEQGLNRRDFIELAINTLKQKQPQDDEGAGLFEAKQTAKLISQKLGAYKELIALQKEISDLQKPLALVETGLDANTKSRMLKDLKDMEAKLIGEMDSLLPEDKIEGISPSEQELQTKDFDGEQAVQEFKARLRDSGFDLDAQLNKPSRKTLESKGEKSIAEENPIEDSIDSFIKTDADEGPMVFGEKATPERKAEVERIGRELEKRKKKKSS